jgi:hypothetical protein
LEIDWFTQRNALHIISHLVHPIRATCKIAGQLKYLARHIPSKIDAGVIANPMKNHPITRRSFLKISAFTAGSYLILSRGTALANPGSGSGTSSTKCTRKWVTRIEVAFNIGYSHHPYSDDKDRGDWSGMVFYGNLRYWYRSCDIVTEQGPVTAEIRSGGYISRINGVVDSRLRHGSDTAWPPGHFRIVTYYSGAGTSTAGFFCTNSGIIRDATDPKNKFRTFMKIHLMARKNGSSGCIVFRDKAGFDDFVEIMNSSASGCTMGNRCSKIESVPLKVSYIGKIDNVIQKPIYTWDGSKMSPRILPPNPDPQTSPNNP